MYQLIKLPNKSGAIDFDEVVVECYSTLKEALIALRKELVSYDYVDIIKNFVYALNDHTEYFIVHYDKLYHFTEKDIKFLDIESKRMLK